MRERCGVFLAGIAVLVFAARPAAGQEEQGFVAVVERGPLSWRLDFTKPPDFVLVMKRPRKDQVEERTYSTTDVPAAKKLRRYTFVKKKAMDEGGNKCVLYEYKSARGSERFYIWTKIDAVAQVDLDYMRIDRAPFCIVQRINEAGIIFPIPMNREDAPEAERFQASGPIPFKGKDGKWGYKDPTNTRVVIEPKFDKAEHFANGRAVVRVSGKAGYIDSKGKYIVKPAFDGRCSAFGKHLDRERALVTQGGKRGMIDRDGRLVIKPIYDTLGPFRDGVVDVLRGGLWGLVDRDGRVILPPRYDRVTCFSEGLAGFKVRDGLWGFADRQGKVVIAPRFRDAAVFRQGLAPVQVESGKYGYIDVEGKLKIEARFDSAGVFRDGLAPVGIGQRKKLTGKSGGKYGFVDTAGKVVIPIRFDVVGMFREGRCEAQLDGAWGWLDRQGNFTPK